MMSPILPIALLAASAAAEAPNPPARWISQWDEGRCQLLRAVGEPLAPIFFVEMNPGLDGFALWIVDPSDDPGGASGEAEIRFAPSGTILTSEQVRRYRQNGTLYYSISGLDDMHLDTLAASDALRVRLRDEILLDRPLRDAAAAITVLRQCVDDQLRAWGIDPQARAALQAQPRPIGRGFVDWVRVDDYPSEALRQGDQGTATVLLAVDANGRVSACRTVVSSGHAALDERTCEVFTDRGRFEPARDSSGKAVPAPIVTRVTWRTG